MKIIGQINIDQENQIRDYIEKWMEKSLLTTPINPPLLEQGIKKIFEEIGLETPSEYLYYSSPVAMWHEFENWKPKITRVLTEFWRYQIPLCDPSSFRRKWRPGNKHLIFNFAAKRYSPGPNKALMDTEESNETSGVVIDKKLHDQIWKKFDLQVPLDWSLIGFSDSLDLQSYDYLQDRADEEDPTNQMHFFEYCYLAPERWLLRELACVDFCHNVLGVDRNERLYNGLESVVENGSFCGLFGILCIACERPAKINIEDNSYKLTFSDDEIVTLYKQ